MRNKLMSAGLAAMMGLGAVGSATVPLSAATAVPRAGIAATQTASRTATQVVEAPISFRVRNVNRSAVACPSDGKTYTVRGHLVGPSAEVNSGRIDAATLYLHGLRFGEFFWSFRQANGYDYATKQARRGQVSVVIDRLGYGASDKPDGTQVCVGSRADITHQMITQLRSGRYQISPSGTAPKVALAGHSYGGQIAQVEAYSFGDIDGLVVIGYADRVQSALLRGNATYAARVCATGGLRVNATGPAGYAPFGPPSGAEQALFRSSPAPVRQAALQLLTIDPCGDTASFTRAVAADLAKVRDIKVPVLVVGGGSDRLFPRPAAADQARLFTGSRSVTQVTVADTAHAFTLERTRNRFASLVSRWLDRHLGRH